MTKCRLMKTEEQTVMMRAKNKEHMAKMRSLMDEDEKEFVRDKDRKRKEKLTNMDPYTESKRYYLKNEREFNRLYKVRMRGNRSEEEIEFDRIDLLIRMRKHRQHRNGKDHLLENLKAKQGMRLLREKGRLKKHLWRNSYEIDYDVEKWLWFHYYNRSPKNREILARKNPDVYNLIVENKERERKLDEEKRQKEKELDEAGRWVYCPANDGYYWSNGEMKWDYEYDLGTDANDAFPCHEMTASDEERCNKQLEEWTEQEIEQQRKERKKQQEEQRLERNRLAREKRKELKDKLSNPIEIDAETEMSEYELLREKNIRELEEAKKNSGWFSD